MVRATSTETRREKTAEQEGRSRRRWAVLGVLGVASFFDGLDANIVAVSLPSIQRDLGTGFATAQWAVAGYSLATAVLLITGGRLGDLHGTKRVFLAGLGGFTLFSGVCALAVTAEMLVAGRVGQGAMAALMLPQAMAVTKRHFQPQEWGLASAVTGVAITAGSIGGPVVGGFLTDLDLFGTGWRAVFWINVPVGAVTLVCGARVLSEGRARRRPMLDLPSTALVTAASLGLMYPLVQGREHGWPSWTPVMLAVAAGLWLLFAVRQRRCAGKGREPLVPPSLFRLPSFTAGLVTALLTFAGATSFTFVLTYYLQFGAAWSPTRTALAVAAVPLGIAAVFQLTWKYGPHRPRLFVASGALAMSGGTLAAMALARSAGTEPGLLPVMAAAFVTGVGTGLCTPVLTAVLLGTLPPRDAGAGAGVIYATTQFGSAAGIAAIGAVFFGVLAKTAAAKDAYADAMGAALWCVLGVFLLVAAMSGCLPRRGGTAGGPVAPL